jgi:uncharacterized membrane protein
MLRKKAVFSIFLTAVFVTFVLTACSSVERGARQGIAGIFNIGGSSGGTGSSPQRDYMGSSQTVP